MGFGKVLISAVAASIIAGCSGQPTSGGTRGTAADSVERRVDSALAKNDDPYVFAMRGPRDSVAKARGEINSWIRYNLLEAQRLKAAGDLDSARFHFHLARFTLRQVTYSGANDSNGDPAEFRGRAATQGSATHIWRDRVDEDMQRMFDTGVLPQGDLLRMYGIDGESGPRERPNQLPRPSVK